jgi:hypothetical protein
MKKRLHTRVPCRLKSRIIAGDKTYKGKVENISEAGMLNVAFPVFSTDEKILLTLGDSSGKHFSLDCDIKWTHLNRNSLFTIKYKMGLKIKDPPREYREFVKSLCNEYP